jgi:hypothetical protein
MAYSQLAGLPAVTAIGPLAAGDPARYALLVGAICVVGWLARSGFLADLLSKPVLIGYLAGIAVIMMTGQLGRLTGALVQRDSPPAEVGSAVRSVALGSSRLVGGRVGPVACVGALDAVATRAADSRGPCGCGDVGSWSWGQGSGSGRRSAEWSASTAPAVPDCGRHGSAGRAGVGCSAGRLHRHGPDRSRLRDPVVERVPTRIASCSYSYSETFPPGSAEMLVGTGSVGVT